MRTVYIGSIPRELNRVMFCMLINPRKSVIPNSLISSDCLLGDSNSHPLVFILELDCHANSLYWIYPKGIEPGYVLHAYKSAKECDSQLIILHETISCLLYSKSNVGTLNFVVQITVYPNSIG